MEIDEKDSERSWCVVCGDRSTGKHYGAQSCDGCKGFFRRSIRKNQKYVCRFDGKCIVDKDHRNTCRKCRLEACYTRGMRKESVQNERDTIALPQMEKDKELKEVLMRVKEERSPVESGDGSSPRPTPSTTTSFLDSLMEAEAALRSLRSSVITKTSDARKEATTGDVTDSMHQQLLLLVEWAKKVERFTGLEMDSQVSLLRAYAAQHLVLCAAYRSTHLKDSLWLTNDTCLPKDSSIVPDVNRVAERIVDQISVAMRKLNIKHFEYVALKGVGFFDPLALPPSSADVETVNDIRVQLLSSLEARLLQTPCLECSPTLRLAQLLLLLPPLVSVSRDLIEDVQLAKLFGLADIDFLMTELLIPGKTS